MIKQILEKEKHLHSLLNQKVPHEDIDEQYKQLFSNSLYESLSKALETNHYVSAHDASIIHFSKKKKLNHYESVLKFNFFRIGDDVREIGYLKTPIFNFKSQESFREVSNSIILNLLIDQERKEIGFYFLKNNQRKIFVANYEKFSFELGEEITYQPRKIK